MKPEEKELVQALEEQGWSLFTPLKKPGDLWEDILAYQSGFTVDGPNCCLNGKPPRLNLYLYVGRTDVELPKTMIEIELAGERPDGRWLSATLHSFRVAEVMPSMPAAKLTAARVWAAFYFIPSDLEVLGNTAAESGTTKERT